MRLSLLRLAVVCAVASLSFPNTARAATPEEMAWSWSVAVGAVPVNAESYEGDFVQVCEGGVCKIVRAGSGQTSAGFASSNATTVQGFGGGFRPFARLKEWNQSRPKLFGGFRGGFRGGCSSCG